MFAEFLKSLCEQLKYRTRLTSFRSRYVADVTVALEKLAQFRGELFPASGPALWIDRADALLLNDKMLADGRLADFDAEICWKFIVDGYYIAKGLIDEATLSLVWQAYEKALADKTLAAPSESHGDGDPYLGRLLDPHLKIPEIFDLLCHPEVLRITNLLFGRKSIPFQTIIGHKGSQQAAHSDAIHMTTYPLGYLIAAWIAFEDIHPDSGPLLYYPKSHRQLPYLLSEDVGIPMRAFKEKGGAETYSAHYEPAVQRYLSANEIAPQAFCPRKGDVLFWHANLVHGGSVRNDLRHSRKAMVCHYFAEGAFTYHDLSGNASRLHKNGFYAELSNDRPGINPR